jgi:hypothetical protein
MLLTCRPEKAARFVFPEPALDATRGNARIAAEPNLE